MDKESFNIIAHRLRPQMYAQCLRLLKDEDEAEDATQDALLKMWVIRERLQHYKSVDALAIAICKNLSISRLRKRKVQTIELSEELHHISTHDAQSMMEETEDRGWLADTINGLPASQMTILKMSQQDGLENKDIAEMLGISETTVRTTLCKARKNLLLALKQSKGK